jgi:hypothetical protein
LIPKFSYWEKRLNGPTDNPFGTAESRSVHRGAFFRFASPIDIHEFYKKRSRPDPKAGFYARYRDDRIYDDSEVILIDRNDPFIDTTLALWGEQEDSLRRIYLRWFPENCTWPPTPGTTEHGILHSLLSNRHHPLTKILRDQDPENLLEVVLERLKNNEPPKENPQLLTDSRLASALEWPDLTYLLAVCLNPASLRKELSRFSEPDSPYRGISPEAQARCVQYFAKNERFLRIRNDSDHDPDFDHGLVHKDFIRAVSIVPKLADTAPFVFIALEWLPIYATKDSWTSDEAEKAVAAWNVDLALDEKERDYWGHQDLGDDLTPTEAIRFHIWRHYPDSKNFSADDPDKVRRLAFYATARVARKNQGTDDKNVLRYEDIFNYALRDGLNFKFAISFNQNVLCDESEDGDAFSAAIREVLPHPSEKRAEDLSYIRQRIIHEEKTFVAEDRRHWEERLRRDDDSDASSPKDGSISSVDRKVSRLVEKIERWEETGRGVRNVAFFLFALYLIGTLWDWLTQ